jgi:hypothetical protein
MFKQLCAIVRKDGVFALGKSKLHIVLVENNVIVLEKVEAQNPVGDDGVRHDLNATVALFVDHIAVPGQFVALVVNDKLEVWELVIR